MLRKPPPRHSRKPTPGDPAPTHFDCDTQVVKIDGLGPVGATFWVTEDGTQIVTEASQLIWTPV